MTKIRDLIQREARIPFYRQLDLYRIEDGHVCGVTGAVGAGFVIEPRDLLLDADEIILDYENRVRKFLNSVPQGITIHFMVRTKDADESLLRDYAASVCVQDESARQFVESKVRAWRKNPFQTKEILLFICLYPKWRKPRSSWIPSLPLALGKKAHRFTAFESKQVHAALRSISGDIADGLRELDFVVREMEEPEILNYLYDLLNPATGGKEHPEKLFLMPERSQLQRASLRSCLLMNPPRADYDSFYLDGYFHQTVNLAGLPESTTLKSIRDFERELGRDYYLTLTLEVPDQEKEKSWIGRERNLARATNFFAHSQDHEALAKAGEADEFLSEIAVSWDKVVYASLAVLVKDRTREGVSEKSSRVLRAMKRLGGAQGLADHMNHDRLFLSFLPLQGGENPLAFPIAANAAAHLLPIQGSWKGTGNKGLLLKTWRDEPLRIDLFDSRLQAKHSIMLGATGAGKSFFTAHILLQFLMESADHEVIVIDLGGSYKKLARALSGAYLEVECSEDYALNPFPAKQVLFPSQDETDATFLQFLKELLQKMIDPDRAWSASEKMILERALREVYERVQKFEAPLLGDIEKQLRNSESGDDEDRRKSYLFAKELSLFTQGEYGKILNRPGKFDFDSRFTVFDLRKISRYTELQEILLFIIPFALKRKFENLAIQKILVLDECWQLLKESQGTELVEVFYRTARKLNAGVLSISQNPEDFLEAKIAGVMVNNSPVKYMLRLKKGHEKLALFGLNDNEIQAAKELDVKPGFYSEVFIKFDDRGVIAKVEPSPLEYWIATTDPSDLFQESKLRRAKPGIPDLEVLETLARRFPNGYLKSQELCDA
ncbi:ATP-binding protein [Omnitrophica bacterium]|nr:ATP-binding protein [Candidatus Omnitrophota bacterium]